MNKELTRCRRRLADYMKDHVARAEPIAGRVEDRIAERFVGILLQRIGMCESQQMNAGNGCDQNGDAVRCLLDRNGQNRSVRECVSYGTVDQIHVQANFGELQHVCICSPAMDTENVGF